MVAMIDRWRRRGSTHNSLPSPRKRGASLRLFFSVLAVAGAVWGVWQAAAHFEIFVVDEDVRSTLRVYVDVDSFQNLFSQSEDNALEHHPTADFLFNAVRYAIGRWETSGAKYSFTLAGEWTGGTSWDDIPDDGAVVIRARAYRGSGAPGTLAYTESTCTDSFVDRWIKWWQACQSQKFRITFFGHPFAGSTRNLTLLSTPIIWQEQALSTNYRYFVPNLAARNPSNCQVTPAINCVNAWTADLISTLTHELGHVTLSHPCGGNDYDPHLCSDDREKTQTMAQLADAIPSPRIADPRRFGPRTTELFTLGAAYALDAIPFWRKSMLGCAWSRTFGVACRDFAIDPSSALDVPDLTIARRSYTDETLIAAWTSTKNRKLVIQRVETAGAEFDENRFDNSLLTQGYTYKNLEGGLKPLYGPGVASDGDRKVLIAYPTIREPDPSSTNQSQAREHGEVRFLFSEDVGSNFTVVDAANVVSGTTGNPRVIYSSSRPALSFFQLARGSGDNNTYPGPNYALMATTERSGYVDLNWVQIVCTTGNCSGPNVTLRVHNGPTTCPVMYAMGGVDLYCMDNANGSGLSAKCLLTYASARPRSFDLHVWEINFDGVDRDVPTCAEVPWSTTPPFGVHRPAAGRPSVVAAFVGNSSAPATIERLWMVLYPEIGAHEDDGVGYARVGQWRGVVAEDDDTGWVQTINLNAPRPALVTREGISLDVVGNAMSNGDWFAVLGLMAQ